MAIIGDRIREVIKKEIKKNSNTIDHQVDCLCRDIRSGKSKDSDVKKVKPLFDRLIKDKLIDFKKEESEEGQ